MPTSRSSAEPATKTPVLHVHVFRVEEGLGNAVVLEFPDRTCAIVDWGTEKDGPLKAVFDIARRGRVRVVAATHDHADHTLGLVKLFEKLVDAGVKIDHFVYPTSQLRDRCKLSAARIRAKELGIPTHAANVRTNPKMAVEPDYLDWEDNLWDLKVLAPFDTETSIGEITEFEKDRAAGNATSLVVLFAFDSRSGAGILGEGKVLFTGDATGKVLENAAKVASQNGLALDNQLMIIPHHGGVSVVPEWLEENIHGVAVISARTNSPHHPQLATLQKLAIRTCGNQTKKLFCTSYAQVCREHFKEDVPPNERHLVAEGPCFGHLVIEVPLSGAARLADSSHNGEQRRRFGWCGNVTSATR